MIGIIIVNYNSTEKTRFCLESLLSQTYTKFKVYLIDNASKNKSIEDLEILVFELKKHINIEFIKSKENLGFSKANNLLIKKALLDKQEFIYILNNDVELSKNTLENFVNFSINKDALIITNKIVFRQNPDTIWFAGGNFDYKNADYLTIGYGKKDSELFSKIMTTDWASGASSFYKRIVFENIGFYDENYFFGQEEWDLSLRALKYGYKIYYDGQNKVYHEVGASTSFRLSFKVYLNTYNRLYFANKHLKKKDAILFSIKYILYSFTIKRLKLIKANKIKINYFKYYRALSISIIDFFKSRQIDSKCLDLIDS